MVSFSGSPTSLPGRTTNNTQAIADAELHGIIVCLNQYLIRKQLLDQEEIICPEMRDDEEDSVGSFNMEKDRAWLDASDDEEVIESDTPWIDVPKPFTIVTFDQATHDAWEVAKQEITTIRSNLKDFLQLDSIQDYTLRAMVEYIVERLWRVVDVSLNHHRKCYSTSNPLTISCFRKIISTFFIASSFGVSTENLFADQWIAKDDLPTKEEYIQFWKACADRDTDRFDPSSVYFWQKLLDEVNELCRDLFLNNWLPYSQKHVTIDDDKVHYNASGLGYSNTSGLKPSQFVRENRKGFTFHTLVLTASGVPLGLEPELVTDSNSSDTSMRLITRQLAPCHRSTNIPNLSNIVIYADRLYWTKSFLYNFIIPSGADIGPCTHKRTHHFPFTYEQKLTRNDTRTLIPTKGSKCIMLKQQRIGPHTLSAVAYRDGYGKIAMGLTSSAQVSIKQWDFHLSNPQDRYRLLDEDSHWSNSLSTWINNIEKEKGLTDRFVNLFSSTCRVKGITTKGSDDQAWFIARGFSFTSSTSDKILNAVYELARTDQRAIDGELLDSLNIILDYLNKDTISVISDNEVGDNLPSRDDLSGSDIPVESDVIVDGCNVSNELRMMNQNQGEAADAFLQKLHSPRMYSDEAVRAFLNLLGASSVRSRQSNCQKIIEWVNLRPIEKRKYYFLKKAALVDCCVRELGGSKTSYSKQSVNELIDVLAQPRSIHARDSNAYPATTPSETPTSSLSETLLTQIVKGSILKPLSGSGRQETRMGLDNELPLLFRLVEETKTAKTLIMGERVTSMHLNVSEVYRAGMARKIGMEYVKTSIDALGVLVGTDHGETQQLIGIELKTRVTEKTRRPEIELRSNLQMGHKYAKINYKLAKRFIPSSHECLQILHHSFVYGLSMVLLVIGDIKSTILRAVLVEFDEEIWTAYRSFLTRCYNQSLKWAYETPDYTNLINQYGGDDDSRLNFMKPMLPSGVDFDSFIDYYKLWKCSTSDDQRLPLPSTEYIVPYHFSKWNKFKGGSDTLTKLFWNGKHYVPHLTPGSNAVSHLFRFIAGMLRRIDAVMGSKDDLACYSSLYAWRHANNQRQTSYQVFVRQIARCLLDRNEASGTSIVTPPRVLGRSSRNRVKEVEAKWAEGATGKTPARRVKERYETDANIDKSVLQRREMCSGNIICRVAIVDGKVKTDGKGVVSICAECGMKTRFFCAQCRVPLCGPAKICNDENGQPQVHFMEGPNQKRIQFLRSCSHIYHEKGLMMEKELRSNKQSESSEDEDSF